MRYLGLNVWVGPVLTGALFFPLCSISVFNCSLLGCRRLTEGCMWILHCSLSRLTLSFDSISVQSLEICTKKNYATYGGIFHFNIISPLTLLIHCFVWLTKASKTVLTRSCESTHPSFSQSLGRKHLIFHH